MMLRTHDAWQLRATASQVQMGIKSQFAYLGAYWLGAVTVVVQVLILRMIWTSVYGDRDLVSGVTLDTAMSTAILAMILGVTYQPFVFDTLFSRLQTGQIVFDVSRPLPAPIMAIAQQLGSTVATFPGAFVATVVGIAIGAIKNSDVVSLPFGALSVALGFFLALVVNFGVGLVGFWTVEIGGAFVMYRMFALFCSGAIVPLWFMPDWLRNPLEWSPFASQVFIPVSILVGQRTGLDIVHALFIQLVWLAVALSGVHLLWKFAVRRLVVFGG